MPIRDFLSVPARTERNIQHWFIPLSHFSLSLSLSLFPSGHNTPHVSLSPFIFFIFLFFTLFVLSSSRLVDPVFFCFYFLWLYYFVCVFFFLYVCVFFILWFDASVWVCCLWLSDFIEHRCFCCCCCCFRYSWRWRQNARERKKYYLMP